MGIQDVIVNYLRNICQLKYRQLMANSGLILLVIFTIGCARQVVKTQSVEPIPSWFRVDKKYADRDSEGNYRKHAFFDPAPFTEIDKNEVNFVMSTPRGSLYGYDLNFKSGALYKRYRYCAQQDVWRKFGGTIKTPPFSIGFIPRVLDQWGKPQMVIAFGKTRSFQEFKPYAPISQRIKIVGGIIQQLCKNYPCAAERSWLSRLVLVGVNPQERGYRDIKNISELKDKVNWSAVKAFMENGWGRNSSGGEESPAYRIIGEIAPEKALSFALKKGHYFQFDELKKMRENCHKLYDYMWTMSEKLVTPKVKQKVIGSGGNSKRAKVVAIDESENISNDDSQYPSYASFFKSFYDKYGKQFMVCERYVSGSNHRLNPLRHWTLEYLASFFYLQNLGYVYNCQRNAWVENPRLPNGNRSYDQGKLLKYCTSNQIHHAFETTVTILTGLQRSRGEHYRYLLYDDGLGGSHQKIYSWVREDAKHLSCKKKYQNEASEVSTLFPHDVNWKTLFNLPKEDAQIKILTK